MQTTPDDSSTHLLHGVTCENAKHHGDTCMGSSSSNSGGTAHYLHEAAALCWCV